MKITEKNDLLVMNSQSPSEKTEQASRQLAVEFMKLFVKQMVETMDIPGSGVERDFIKDSLVDVFANEFTRANSDFVNRIKTELSRIQANETKSG